MHLQLEEGSSGRPPRSRRGPSRHPDRRAASNPGARPESQTSRPLEGLRVLVVEDHADSRELLGRIVESLGGRAVLTENGRAALEALAGEKPDVVLCDLLMPGMDGFAFVREVRVRPEWNAIPILAVTALGSDADYRRTWEAGFDGHLTKPVEATQLAAVIEAITRGRSGGQTPER